MFSGCPGFGSDFLEQWPDSLMHTVCLSLYPSFSLSLLNTRDAQDAHIQASYFLSYVSSARIACQRYIKCDGCLIRSCSKPCSKTIRNLKMHNVVSLWAKAQRPEEKICLNSSTTRAFSRGKFSRAISRPAVTHSNHGEYLTQVL